MAKKWAPGEWAANRLSLEDDPKTMGITDWLFKQPAFLSWRNLMNGVPGERFQGGICKEAAFVEATAEEPPAQLRPVHHMFFDRYCAQTLLRVWGKVSELGREDLDEGHEEDFVVDYAGLGAIDKWSMVPHFGHAMAEVGWAVEETNCDGVTCVRFPKFLRRNTPVTKRGRNAKSNAGNGGGNGAKGNAERQAAFKARRKLEKEQADAKAEGMSNTAPNESDAPVTAGESLQASQCEGVTAQNASGNGAGNDQSNGVTSVTKAPILEDKKEHNSNTNTPLPPLGGIEGGIEKEQKKKRSRNDKPMPAIPASLDTPEFKEIFERWVTHRREKNAKLTPTSMEQQFKDMVVMGVLRAIAAMRFTIGKGWVGLREPDLAQGASHARNGPKPDASRVFTPTGKYDGKDIITVTSTLRQTGQSCGSSGAATAETAAFDDSGGTAYQDLCDRAYEREPALAAGHDG